MLRELVRILVLCLTSMSIEAYGMGVIARSGRTGWGDTDTPLGKTAMYLPTRIEPLVCHVIRPSRTVGCGKHLLKSIDPRQCNTVLLVTKVV